LHHKDFFAGEEEVFEFGDFPLGLDQTALKSLQSSLTGVLLLVALAEGSLEFADAGEATPSSPWARNRGQGRNV
jgi:hypothetical protein